MKRITDIRKLDNRCLCGRMRSKHIPGKMTPDGYKPNLYCNPKDRITPLQTFSAAIRARGKVK